jgi:hypothetical protein
MPCCVVFPGNIHAVKSNPFSIEPCRGAPDVCSTHLGEHSRDIVMVDKTRGEPVCETEAIHTGGCAVTLPPYSGLVGLGLLARQESPGYPGSASIAEAWHGQIEWEGAPLIPLCWGYQPGS